MSDLRIEGFKLGETEIKHRLIIASEGPERSGKTNFGLTLPSPLAVLPLDNGTDEIIAKFQKTGKRILVPTETLDWDRGERKEEYEKLWKRTETAFNRCLNTKGLRALFIDTGTEFWELMRLAAFGKVTQVKPQHYSEVNESFRKLIRAASDSNISLVLSHKVKKRYITPKARPGQQEAVRDGWDGTWERAGMSDVGFLCQMNIEHGFNYTTHSFYIRIKDCRQNMDLAGMTIGMGGTPEQETCDFELEPTFANLGMLAYPESSEEDWT